MIGKISTRAYRRANTPTSKNDGPGFDKPSVVVIKRKGSHIQYITRGNVIYLPAPYIREHYLELENAGPRDVV